MNKDAYYFSHDSNARNDEKILNLRMEFDWLGYGIYWAIVEMLREATNNELQTNYKSIAYCLRTDEKTIEAIINNFDLFEVKDGVFWSVSLKKRMEIKEAKKKKAKDAANIRWSKDTTSPDEKKMDIPQFYVIKCYNDNEEFFKVGCTSGTISRRFSGKLPYQYEVVRQIFTPDYVQVESYFNELLSHFTYTPRINFSGKKECYAMVAIETINKIEVIDFEVVKDYKNNVAMQKNNVAMRRNAKERKGKESKYIPPISPKREGEFYESETEFLNNWKKARQRYDGKPTNIKQLDFVERNDFNRLKNEFTKQEFQQAIQGLFLQKGMMPTTRVRPKHFLNDRNIEKYLDAFRNKTQLYAKSSRL